MTMTRATPMLAQVRLLTPATAAIAATAATAATAVITVITAIATTVTVTQATAVTVVTVVIHPLAEDPLLVQWTAKTVDTPTPPMSTTTVL